MKWSVKPAAHLRVEWLPTMPWNECPRSRGIDAQLPWNAQDGEDVRFNLLTAPDPEDLERQAGYLEQIRDGIAPLGVEFSWAFDGTSTIHARHLVTDTGWKILLDRGLDVFQRADLNNGFSPANRHQRFRPVKAFEVTYLREGVDVSGG